MVLIVLITLVAAIILNSYIMRREAIRREYEHERRQERFERLMNLLEKPNSDKTDEVNGTTKDQEKSPDSYRD